MTLELTLFLAGQAIALLLAIVGTYIKLAVRLTQIELTIQHTDNSSVHNAHDLSTLKADLHKLTLKVETIQTTQQLFCSTCPMRGIPHDHAQHKGRFKNDDD